MSVSSSVSASTSTSNTLTAFVVGVAVGAAFSSSVSKYSESVSESEKKRYGVNFYDYYGSKLNINFCSYSDCSSSKFYSNPVNYDGRFGGSGILKRYSRRIGGGLSFGVHHFLILDTPNWYCVYEWMDDDRAHCGVTKSLRKENGRCQTYQRENIKDVWLAVKKATMGKTYSKNYNCNHWCDRVLHELGYNGADSKWNCVCVTNSDHPMWVEDACTII